ncbi:hypothetical protein [Bovine papular stomatitis virus]
MKYMLSVCVTCLLATLSLAAPATTNHVTDTSNTTTSAVTNTSTVSTPTTHHLDDENADNYEALKVVGAIFLIVATFLVIAIVVVIMVKRSMCDWCCVYCPCCNDDEDDEENERLDAMLEHFPSTDSSDLVKMYAGTGAC